MPTGIDPTIDYAFKGVFGRERNRDVLLAFLNCFVPWRLTEIEIQDPFTGKEDLDDKLSVLDVRARDDQLRQYDLEAQVVAIPEVRVRSVFYWAKMYASQLDAGQTYKSLRPAVSIWIVDDIVVPESEGWLHNFQIRNAAPPHGVFTDHCLLVIIELPRFQLAVEDVRTDQEAWVYFLKHGKDLDLDHLPPQLDRPAIRRAIEELTRMSHNDVERLRYEQRERGLRDWATSMTVSREEGREQGRQEGLQEGRQEGREEERRDNFIRLIQFCQEVLQQALTPLDELGSLETSELRQRSEALQREVRNRRS